jgi:hypothetical protein
MTTKQQISDWFDRGLSQKASHMIVVCDTFEHEDYPVFVAEHEEVREKSKQYNGQNMQKIMEVYDLSISKEEQLSSVRVFNY